MHQHAEGQTRSRSSDDPGHRSIAGQADPDGKDRQGNCANQSQVECLKETWFNKKFHKVSPARAIQTKNNVKKCPASVAFNKTMLNYDGHM